MRVCVRKDGGLAGLCDTGKVLVRAAVDWDGTLVDASGSFLPGAVGALRSLKRRGWVVSVYSCRASWAGGRGEIRAVLDAAGLRWVDVWCGVGKPRADVYVDDRAVRFEGDWSVTFRSVLEVVDG